MSRYRLLASIVAALALAAPADAAGAATVSGRVLDARGKPAVGATVTTVEFRRGGTPNVRSAPSGPDGSFSLPAPKEMPDYGLMLLAVARGGGLGSLLIRGSEPRTGITLQLEDASSAVTGRVVDTAGRPIAGVAARLRQVRIAERSTWFPDEVEAPRAVTDARGRFRLTGIPKGTQQVSLRFHHPRYARYENWRLWESGTTSETGTEIKPIRLHAASRIEGRVLYQGGKPVTGARLRIWQESGPDPHFNASAEAKTDGSGRYRVDQLPPGRYRVALQDGTHAGAWVARSRRVDRLPEGKTAVCDALVLIRGGVAPGVVTNRETGAPVVGAHVSANRSGPGGWEQGSATTSEKDGRFRLRLPPGTWTLQVSHQRYVEPWQDDNRQGVPVTVAEGQTAAETRHTLRPYSTLTVRVLGPDDRPDPRAQIVAPFMGDTRVGPDGSVLLERLKPDSTTSLVVRGGDRTHKAVVETTVKKGENPPLTIRLARCLKAEGRVLDARGRPMRGVEVEATRRVELGERSWMDARIDGERTRADGRFTLWLLPGQEYTVQTRHPGYSRAHKPNVTLRDTPLDLGALTINPANRTITGRVTDANGDPVTGVRISCYSQEQQDGRQALTDATGRYRLTELAAGRVSVNLEHPPHGFDSRNDVEAGATGVDFVLTPREETRPAPRLKPGDRAPALLAASQPANREERVRWLNGRGTGPGPLKGRVLVLQFATPHNTAVESSAARLGDLHRRYAGRGVAVLALYDASLPEQELAAYVKARGILYPVGVVPARNLGWTSGPFRSFGVHSVPSVYLIDRSGVVRAVNPTPEKLEQEVRRLAR